MKVNFGNKLLIEEIRHNEEIMAGRINCDEINWHFCRVSDHTTETRNSITYDIGNIKEATAVKAYVKCPGCKKLHKLVVQYNPHAFPQIDEWLQVDEQVREFSCWNCGLEFETDDDRMVYVKQNVSTTRKEEIAIGDNQLLLPFTSEELNLGRI